jgi:hypothetical protein
VNINDSKGKLQGLQVALSLAESKKQRLDDQANKLQSEILAQIAGKGGKEGRGKEGRKEGG